MDIEERRERAREYLRGYIERAERAEEIRARIERLSSEAYGLKGIDTTKERIQCSPKTHDTIGELIGRIDEQCDRLMQAYADELEERQKIADIISNLTQAAPRRILFARYIGGALWRDIANDMSISLRWAHHLEDLGLDEIYELIETA